MEELAMSTSDDLKQAYRLIKRDQPEEARDFARLVAEPENVHAWWRFPMPDNQRGPPRK
jgi:hypothetical protein